MYGGELLDDSAYGHSSADEQEDHLSDISQSNSELENFLYSQIHYQFDDAEKIKPVTCHPQIKDKEDVIVISDSEQPKPATITPNSEDRTVHARFVEKTVSCSSDNSDDAVSLDAPVQLQFNAGTSLFLSGNNSRLTHPLMSVRQQYSRYSSSPKKRYFTGKNDLKLGDPTSLIAKCSENNGNTEFYCYICGETSHLSKMCHLQLNDQRSRRNFNKSDEKDPCSTCGRKNHHPRSWLIRGPPRLVCPNLRCITCGDAGHKLTECADYESVRGRVCRRCGIPGHLAAACPDLWRMFHATNERNEAVVEPVSTNVTINDRRFCYVCGRRGHFGFECFWEFRPSAARFLKSPFISTYVNSNQEDDERLCDDNGEQNGHIFFQEDGKSTVEESNRPQVYYQKRRKIDAGASSDKAKRTWQPNYYENGRDYSHYKTKDEIMRENRRKFQDSRQFDRRFRDFGAQKQFRGPQPRKVQGFRRHNITFS